MGNNFTGYIDKNGKYIEDGLKHRPVPFRAIDNNNVVLTWLVREDGKFYERDFHYQVDGYSTNPPIEVMKVGIEAHECLKRWMDEPKNS